VRPRVDLEHREAFHLEGADRERLLVDRELRLAAFHLEAADRERRVVRPPGHLLEAARLEAAVVGPAAAVPEQTQ